MSNNKSIQFLRTRKNTAVRDTDNLNKTVIDGQPVYDSKNNWLYVANITSNDADKDSIDKACVETIHPNYREECLTDDEVKQIWDPNYVPIQAGVEE